MIKKQYKNHISYEIAEDDVISNLGFKTILRQSDYMLPIRVITYNGKTDIICGTEAYSKEDIKELDTGEIVLLIKSLSGLLRVCEESAFLDSTYIDVSWETVYFDQEKGMYCFPVIPVDKSSNMISKEQWENGLKSFLSQLLAGRVLDSTLSKFRDDLIATGSVISFVIENAPLLSDAMSAGKTEGKDLELSYNGPYGAFTFYVCKEEFIIGKSGDCDGILSMNPTVSRHHCMFKRVNGIWYVCDLGSRNGTFAGNAYLVPQQFTQIYNGELVRISDMEFAVSI